MNIEDKIRIDPPINAQDFGVPPMFAEMAENYARWAVAAEREACAKVCEETTAAWTQHLYNSGCVDCAVAIRARGQK